MKRSSCVWWRPNKGGIWFHVAGQQFLQAGKQPAVLVNLSVRRGLLRLQNLRGERHQEIPEKDRKKRNIHRTTILSGLFWTASNQPCVVQPWCNFVMCCNGSCRLRSMLQKAKSILGTSSKQFPACPQDRIWTWASWLASLTDILDPRLSCRQPMAFACRECGTFSALFFHGSTMATTCIPGVTSSRLEWFQPPSTPPKFTAPAPKNAIFMSSVKTIHLTPNQEANVTVTVLSSVTHFLLCWKWWRQW